MKLITDREEARGRSSGSAVDLFNVRVLAVVVREGHGNGGEERRRDDVDVWGLVDPRLEGKLVDLGNRAGQDPIDEIVHEARIAH